MAKRKVSQAKLRDLQIEASFFEGLAKRAPDWADIFRELAGVYTEMGLYEKAAAADLRNVELLPEDGSAHYNLAQSFCGMHEYDLAAKYLCFAAELGFEGVDQVLVDPAFAGLRKHPGFESILERINRFKKQIT